MKIKTMILWLCGCLLGITAQAQTLAQAKELYQQERYAQAKPVFKKYTKSQPGNGNYHLWYGVCCLKTGETAPAVKHLEMAVKKRIPSGQLYLGQAYHQSYRFEEAIHTYEEYIRDLTKRKRDTGEAEKLLDKSRLGLRLLKGVEKVCFIDSVVVDKEDFLKAYRISPECGKLYTYEAYFKNEKTPENTAADMTAADSTAADSTSTDATGSTVYETQLGNKLYYAERQPDGLMSILQKNKMQDQWGRGHLLPGAINQDVNANYPYVMSDGITIFYAADGPQSLGGYDIFLTRYHTSQDTYLNPQNAGMPFNSPANDYLYVIDEYNNLGWFASDRYQPEGKVCIYTFIPNASKQVYDFENTDKPQLMNWAKLHAIRDTWQEEAKVKEALARLQQATQVLPEQTQKPDFEFVIDDEHTYHRLADFQSKTALDAYVRYRQLEDNYRERQQMLHHMRVAFSQADEAGKQELSPGILDLEKWLDDTAEELQRLTREVRKLEKMNGK